MKKALIIIIGLLVVIQFFTIDKTNPTADMSKDFVSITNPPAEIGEKIKSACYDCHSFHTRYPWYANVAPASWLLKEHVNNGRGHLNFSIWTEYQERKKDSKIEECIEMVKSGEMPLKGYVMFHDEAVIDQEQKMALLNWFGELRDSLKLSEK